MDLDDINAGLASEEIAEKTNVQQLERVNELDMRKDGSDDIDPTEEKKLVRKLDLWYAFLDEHNVVFLLTPIIRIVPLMMVTYTLQSYDKGIISSATQFGMNTELGLTVVIGHNKAGTPITNNVNFSNASMIFYIGYLCGTYPMMYLSQKYSTSKVLSLSIFLWGAVVMSTAGCYNYAGIMLNRFFLGVLESSVAPAFTVLVTFWWTREEQALRTGLWYSCVGVATTISPLINYGLGQIHSSLEAWKPLFLILGAVTVLWSIVLFFCLPDSPLTTKGLTEPERVIAIKRLQRNNAGTISHKFDRAQFLEAFKDLKLYSCTLIILLTGVPSGALGTFGTVVINGFGFSHFASLALTCPIGGITAISIIACGYITRKINNIRHILIIILALISIAGTIICWAGPKDNRGLLFAGIFLMAVQVAAGGLAVSLAASNVAGHTSTFLVHLLPNFLQSTILIRFGKANTQNRKSHHLRDFLLFY